MADSGVHSSALRLLARDSAISRATRAAFLCSALGSAAAAPTVLAQEAATPAHEVAVPAGNLADALDRFAQQTGASLHYDPASVAGRTSPGLNATVDVQTGLATLLQSSGLEAVRNADGGYTVRARATAQDATTLPAVRIEARADASVTEATGSYTTQEMRSATKLPLSIRETPQSVTVITRERLDAANIVDLIDVVDTAPGLVTSYSAARPSFEARGFEIDRITQDGIASLHDSYIPSSLGNAAMQDRVEIVRGATGLMQGAGNPSAAINLIRKRPHERFQAETSFTAASWDDYRVQADVGGPLTKDGGVRARAVGYFQDANNFRDIEEDDNAMAYATVDFDLSDDTLLNLGYSYLDIHGNLGWGGIPLGYDGNYLDVPRSIFVGIDWEFIDNTVGTTYASLDHAFGSGWSLKLNAAYTKADTELLSTAVAPSVDVGGYGHVWWAVDKRTDQKAVDAYISGPVEVFGRSHELVLGGAMNHETSDITEWFDVWEPTSTTGVDFSDWNHSAPRPDTSPDSPYRYDYETESKQDSLYATGRIALLDKLKMILGARWDWYSRTALWGGDPYEVDANLTQYAGLVYELPRQHSLYLSYSDVFQPQDARGTDGEYLDPIVGENYEAGVKGEYFDGALNASAAVFLIDQNNRARMLEDQSACPMAPAQFCYAASGLVRSQGFDLELQGALTPDWQISAGLTRARAEYRKDEDLDNIGKPLNSMTPKTQLKLSSEYRLPGELNCCRALKVDQDFGVLRAEN